MKRNICIVLLCITVLFLSACAKEAEMNLPEEPAEVFTSVPDSEAVMPEMEVFEEPPISVDLCDWEDLKAFWNADKLDEEAYAAYAEDEYFFGYYSQEDITQIKNELSQMPFPYAEGYEFWSMEITPEYERVILSYRADETCQFRYFFGSNFDEAAYQAEPETYTPIALYRTEEVQDCYMVGEEEYLDTHNLRSIYVLNVDGKRLGLFLFNQPKEHLEDSLSKFEFGTIEDVLAKLPPEPVDTVLTFDSHRRCWEFLQCESMDYASMMEYLRENGYADKGITGRKDVQRISRFVWGLPAPMTAKMEISNLTIDPEAETVEVLLSRGEKRVLCRMGGDVQLLSEGKVLLPKLEAATQIHTIRDGTGTEESADGVRFYSLMVEDQPMEVTTTGITREEFMELLDTFTFFELNYPPEWA